MIDIVESLSARPDNQGARFYIDVSQDVQRRPWTLNWLRSLTTSTELFAMAEDRLLIPEEHYRLLGYPPDINLDNLSKLAKKDLAGEAMSPASVGLILLCALNALFPPSSTDR